jgi:class 3 adenylate cyclase/tetratricopeptide (TPR) repeat protein
VVDCPGCGLENPDGNRFCGSCGATLSAPAVERRKLVTSVFCDLAGSTAMGERADAERVFELMRSYFDTARAALERHGGAVEKFIGDAVVGMFGVPEAHEDDALRACRAALEIEEQTARLGIPVRIGVNTGEVVAGDAARREMFASGDAVVLGDAVNVAARLEQAAAPGEVLIGEATHRLVRDAVRAEEVEPIQAKGKSEPVKAYRLLEAEAHGTLPRRADTPLVGRGAELVRLESEFDQSAHGCRLVTVMGEAGVGKSRLAAELAVGIGGRARIVRGACLSYGEGITYWAISQVVRELAGIDDDDSVEEVRERVSGPIAQLLGVVEGTVTADETAGAVAEFLAVAASGRPLVVLVDDIHWAEPALLNLLESLPALAGDAPVLLLCLARPELREHRPDWPVTITVEPLGAGDIDALLESLQAPSEARVRLALGSGGNPLYAEELVAWVQEGGDADDLPTSINALLGARLDRLRTGERDALERGAVEGELFHRGAVVELTDRSARGDVAAGLDELTRKDMIRLSAASLAGELVAYRFKHILVRDAAYRGTTKRLRAALHERYAEWLEHRAGSRVAEVDEILGYHLEQACRYRIELGEGDEGLGARAAKHLGASGARAAARADHHAAANLLDRAVKLLPDDSVERLDLLYRYSVVIDHSGHPFDAQACLDEIVKRAEALGEPAVAARARNKLVSHAVWGDPDVDLDAQLEILESGYTILSSAGDPTALAEAAREIGMLYRRRGSYADAAEWLEQAHAHAQLGDNHVAFQQVTRSLAHVLVDGPMPAPAAHARCEELLRENRGDRILEATLSSCLAELSAMSGRFDEARHHLDAAVRVFGPADTMLAALAQATIGRALALLADRAGAQEAYEARWRFFSRYADGRPEARAIDSAEEVAAACCDNGRWDEAERWLALYESVPRRTSHRLASEARVAAHHGDHVTAHGLAKRAVESRNSSDALNERASRWLTLAEVQRAAGDDEGANAAMAEAAVLYELKANVAALSVLRELEERLAAAVQEEPAEARADSGQ